MKRKLTIIFLIVFLVIALVYGYKVINEYHENKEQEAQFEKIAEFIDDDTETSDTGCSNKYDELYSQNNDFVGMIKIPDTNINYPVMQTKSDPNYYLRRNFNKEYSAYGTPYIQENCDIDNSDNVIVYGHNMKTKAMFHDLTLYADYDFYKEHKYISFNTKDNEYTYEIIAVIKTVADSDDFDYSSFVNTSDEKEYLEYVNECKELSLFDTNQTAEYGDKLLTLSTCEYSKDNGRMVVVAKRVRDKIIG
jgi:sortase B